jgi:PhzF family phenazine biosynthesis protein
MTFPLFCVDAFTDTPFTGNPAAVCLLKVPATSEWMQQVAAEMNLSDTAFCYPMGANEFSLRWFTPKTEVELCGHATLATTHVLIENGVVDPAVSIRFVGRWHTVGAKTEGTAITLDFPLVETALRNDIPEYLFEGLRIAPRPVCTAGDEDRALIELPDEEMVRALAPDFSLLKKVNTRGVIVTSPGSGDVDFVSRFFAPAAGIDEDPVTGSAHCALAHYWRERLGKECFHAKQVSARGGAMAITIMGDRVNLTGKGVTVWRGELNG